MGVLRAICWAWFWKGLLRPYRRKGKGGGGRGAGGGGSIYMTIRDNLRIGRGSDQMALTNLPINRGSMIHYLVDLLQNVIKMLEDSTYL